MAEKGLLQAWPCLLDTVKPETARILDRFWRIEVHYTESALPSCEGLTEGPPRLPHMQDVCDHWCPGLPVAE